MTDYLQELLKGNENFASGSVDTFAYSKRLEELKDKQNPKAVILSCMDSRVPTEIVFNKNLGEIFVVRNAGNIANKDILASLEYATAVVGSSLIVVMGHTGCGAIKAACEQVELGHITKLVERLKPAVVAGENQLNTHDVEDPNLIKAIAVENVHMQMNIILKHSAIIADLIEQGKVHIQGMLFDLKDGKVRIL